MISPATRAAVARLCAERSFSCRLEGSIRHVPFGVTHRLSWRSNNSSSWGVIASTTSWSEYCEAVLFAVEQMRLARETWRPAMIEPETAGRTVEFCEL